MSAENGRTEGRAQKMVPLQLTHSDPQSVFEICFTENVSPHGARILTHQLCCPRDRLSVVSLSGKFRSQAIVVYCQAVAQRNSYAVGVRLIEPAGEWISNPAIG